MATAKEIARVMFREAVNLPGDGQRKRDGANVDRINVIGSSTESIFPVKTGVGIRVAYKAYWQDGWVCIEHPTSKVVVRYPASMVREMVLAEDVPGWSAGRP